MYLDGGNLASEEHFNHCTVHMDKIVVKKKNANWFTFSLCYCQTLYPYFNFTSFPIVEDDKLLLPFHFWSILLTPALSILNLFIYQVSLRLHKLCTSVCMINNVTCHNECLNIFLKLTWHMVHHGLFVVRQTLYWTAICSVKP